MGGETDLGAIGDFAGFWAPMMAAMMLPAAVPAVAATVRSAHQAWRAAPFVAAYLAVWLAAGLVIYALYRPHGDLAAGLLVAAVGVYELTPFKCHCRLRCRQPPRSGFEFGAYRVASSAGLMAALLALGPMSLTWMVAIAALVFW